MNYVIKNMLLRHCLKIKCYYVIFVVTSRVREKRLKPTGQCGMTSLPVTRAVRHFR